MTDEDDSKPPKNVVPLRPSTDERPELFLVVGARRDYSKPKCFHDGQVTICEDDRTLACSKCGADVDPFRFIGQIANEVDRLRALYKEGARMRAEIAKLEDIRRKLRSSVRGMAKRVFPLDARKVRRLVEGDDEPWRPGNRD